MELEDLEGIRNLLSGHCYCVDEVDADGFVALFTEDGSFSFDSESVQIPLPPVVGKAALHEFAATSFPLAAGVHFSTNERITVNGDEATAISYAIALRDPDNPRITTAARMSDRLRKVDGQWLISSRVVRLKLVGEQ